MADLFDDLMRTAEAIVKERAEMPSPLVKSQHDWKTYAPNKKEQPKCIAHNIFPSTLKIAYRQFWLVGISVVEYKETAVYESMYDDKIVINEEELIKLLWIEEFLTHWFRNLTLIQIKELK